MKGAENLVLRAIIVDGIEDKIKSIQKDCDMIDWDSVDIYELQSIGNCVDQLVLVLARTILNKDTKLKPE